MVNLESTTSFSKVINHMFIKEIKRKVCIVGSGFCGFSAYKKLKEENIELLVIEGGNLETPSSESESTRSLLSLEVPSF